MKDTEGRVLKDAAKRWVMKRDTFTHLHVHSCYSLLEGASRPAELLDAAEAAGMKALALTDTDGLYGAIPFYQAARQRGIQPILGVTLTDGAKRVVCLARSREGYAGLCRLVTERHLNDDFRLLDAVARHQRDLVVLVDRPKLLDELAERIEHRWLFAELVQYGPDDLPELRKMYKAARKRKLPVVASGGVYFHQPDRHPIQRVLTAIRHQSLLDDVPESSRVSPEAWLKPPEAFQKLWKDVPEAVGNTQRIAEACQWELPMHKPIFPSCRLPEGETAYSYLCKLAFDGLAERYRPIGPEALRRLEHELNVIHQLGFAPYFLIVHDIVNFARRRDIPVVGRGSAADSLVSYCLGISSVDPIAYDLYFERFLNLSRTDCPDIDLDFCWRGRDEVIDYIYRTYGETHVAMIATHSTFQARSAFRDVAKVYGLPPREVDELASRLPFYSAGSIRACIASFPESRDFPIDTEPIGQIVDTCALIDGFPRHLSIHVGGLVIADSPLPYYVPLQRAPKGIVITQYDMGPIEDLGLVKMDILAQRSLSIIADTVKMVRQNTGRKVDVDALPPDDARTAGLLRTGRTIGCFQIESPGMRNLLQMLKAENRLDVIHALSLIRPGPSSSGMKERFIKRRLGREPVKHLHPALADVLGETYGVMLFQEDILKVAQAVAGFDLAVGDELRKAMSKHRHDGRMHEMRDAFIQGAIDRGASPSAAEKLWELVSNFAQYSYCKAHACTYGHISYQATYLKARYPAEFLASVLNNIAGFYPAREYLEEARRWGVDIRLPHVNESARLHTTGRDAQGNPWLRVGLWQVAALQQRHTEAIVAGRKERPFASLAEVCRRVPLRRQEAQNLVECGALDGLGHTRPEMLWLLDTQFREWVAARRRPGALPMDLSGTTDSACPSLPEYDRQKRLELEMQVLKLTPSAHPLTYYAELLKGRRLCPSRDLPEHVGRTVSVAGWLVATRRARTKRDQFMMFLTLEDQFGTMEVTLFPEAYQKCGWVLMHGGPYLATGTVENQQGALTVTAESLEVLDPDPAAADRRDQPATEPALT